MFAILFLNNCKKDTQPSSEFDSKVSPVELTQNIDQIQNPEIKELAELLEVKMKGSKLVRHFKKSGQPLWEKVVLSADPKGGTEIIVPFAKEGHNLLTAILICQKYNGKYYYHFVTAKELDGAKARRLNKEGSKYLLMLLKMNNLVYSTTDFSYPLSSIHGASRKGRPMIKIHAEHAIKVDSKQGDGWVSKYTCITWNKNCTWQDSNCNPVCDMCSYCAVTECTMDLVYVLEESTLDDDPLDNPTGGNSGSYPTVYEYYERNYGQAVNQLIINLNLSDAESVWLAGEPEIADEINTYLLLNGQSSENLDFAKWAVGYLRGNQNIVFEDLIYNRTDFDLNTGDIDNNVSGGYDNTTYSEFNYQQNWPNISNVIPTNQFVGWNRTLHPGWECMEYAKAQIGVKGYGISDYGDAGQTFQIYTEQNGANQTKLVQGLSYLKYALTQGIPVIVGVNHSPGHPGNLDYTTDHFIVIVGMGTDSNGKYFSFYDNASGIVTKGANLNNKLYLNSTTGLISGSSNATPYATGLTYVISMIRKSKTL